MGKTIKIVKQEEKELRQAFDNKTNVDILFREIQKDTIGKSGSCPTWGYTYSNKNGKLKYKGIGLHKEYDYDAPKASYAEKVWSIIGKKTLDGVRVPDIDIVDEANRESGIISYRLLDNDKEDLIHIRDILFNKFERTDFKDQRDVFNIEDLLECIKIQVKDEMNFVQIRKQIIQTLLLDSITNNGDRHANNWALVRDKQTNKYELAVFDHSSSFVDMLDERPYFTVRGWVSSYTSISQNKNKLMMGSCGDEIIKYIYENHKEEFEEFSTRFDESLPNILEEISNEDMDIDKNRLEKKLRARNHLLKRMKSKEELEYE